MFDCDVVGSGAIGSFVVIPPNQEDSIFKELCEKNKVTYTPGNGFYVVKRTEKVSVKKQMILHNRKNDTFVVSSGECRKILGFGFEWGYHS